MNTITYILDKRVKQLKEKENIPQIVLLLINLSMFFFVSMEWSRVVNSGGVTPSILFYLSILIITAPLFSLFLPTFTMKKNVLPPYLPVKRRTLFWIDFILFLFNRPALSAFSMVTGFLIFLKAGDVGVYLVILFSLVNSIALIEYVSNLISWKKYVWAISFVPAIFVLLIPKLLGYKMSIEAGIQFLLFLILAPSCWFTFSNKYSTTKHQRTSKRKINKIMFLLPLKEIIANKTTRSLIAIYFIAKIFILLVLPKALSIPVTTKNSFIGDPIQLMFFFPILLFAYIYNNSFGFFKTLFIGIYLYNDRTLKYISLYMSLFLPFLFTDAIISIVYLIINHLFNCGNVLIYIIVCLYSIIVAIMSSCLEPRKIETLALGRMNKNTSTIANLILMVPVFGISLIHINYACYLIPIICLLLSLIAFVFFIKRYSFNWQFRIINALK